MLRTFFYILFTLIMRLLRAIFAPINVSAVKLEFMATGSTYDLDPAELVWFWEEFQRATLHPPEKGLYPGIAPDCLITIQTNRGDFVYEICGQTVLYDANRDINWQFYMGLMLIEWCDL